MPYERGIETTSETTADEAYGQVKYLRVWLEEHDAAHVLATKCNDTVVTSAGGDGRVDQLIAALPARAWRCLSVGAGAHGLREYDWARVPIRIDWRSGRGHWLLARRSKSDGEIAYYICYGPRRATLADLARIAGSRWRIEECFQQAKNEAGLDHYQVRTYRAWYAHITLSMLALAWLAVTKSLAIKGDQPSRTRHDQLHVTGDPPTPRQSDLATRTRTRSHLAMVTLATPTPTPSTPQPLQTQRASTPTSAVAVLSQVQVRASELTAEPSAPTTATARVERVGGHSTTFLESAGPWLQR